MRLQRGSARWCLFPDGKKIQINENLDKLSHHNRRKTEIMTAKEDEKQIFTWKGVKRQAQSLKMKRSELAASGFRRWPNRNGGGYVANQWWISAIGKEGEIERKTEKKGKWRRWSPSFPLIQNCFFPFHILNFSLLKHNEKKRPRMGRLTWIGPFRSTLNGLLWWPDSHSNAYMVKALFVYWNVSIFVDTKHIYVREIPSDKLSLCFDYSYHSIINP